ncbi:MAG TPA: hypothetical protein VIC27_05145, partial [Ktedonobacterales bacterium]
MRDDTTDPRDARDSNHIWLRQSVTFSVNGQTRTLELALPLRPGATPDEIDALLDEADAGMRRLSQRLDAHLAEITGATAASAMPTAPARPAPHSAASEAAPAAQPTAPLPASAPASAERPTPRTDAPTPSAPAAAPASAPAAAAQQPARPSAPVAVPAAAPASGGPDLTRPEFLAAAGTLGLDARTVMERLNVRSLNGLNLREALDLLRRQVLREGGVPADAPPTPAAAPANMPANMPAPIGRARFDEEDDGPDFELSYPDPDDLPGDEDDFGDEDFAPHEAAPAAPLHDVPDLDDLLATPAPVAPTTAAPTADENAIHTRALIANLRAAHAGGQPTAQQRMAYRNIVVDQLGEAKASSVARAVWGVTPDKLGPEQFDAFNRWGKEDAFAEEAEDALTLLRAEWAAQQATQQATQQAATPAERPAPARRPPAQTPPAQAPAQ